MGLLLALAYVALGVFGPAGLVIALLAGTVVDWPFHRGALVIYSNELALAGSVLGLSLRQVWRKDLPPLPRWMLWAALPPLAVTLLHMLGPGTAAMAFKDTLRDGQFMLGVLLPAWLLRGRNWERARLFTCAFTLGVIGLGLAQWWAGPGAALNSAHASEVFYGLRQAAASCFQHHNQFGAFLTAALPFSLAAGAPLLALLGLLALDASYSRGAAVGLLLGVAAQAWAFPWRRSLAVAGMIAAFLGAGALASPALRLRLASVFDAANNSDRALLRGIGAEMAAEGNAWWGRGPGQVGVELPARLDKMDLRPQDRAMFQAHLHDQWLQWRVELGWLGWAAWAGFFGALVVAAWRAVAQGGPGRAYGLALAVAVIAFCAQSFTDRLALHARGLDIALLWGLCLAGMRLGDEHG